MNHAARLTPGDPVREGVVWRDGQKRPDRTRLMAALDKDEICGGIDVPNPKIIPNFTTSRDGQCLPGDKLIGFVPRVFRVLSE